LVPKHPDKEAASPSRISKYLVLEVLKRERMLSKVRIKFIKSLQLKKYRKEEQCFVVEGAKSVREVLASDFEIVTLAATAEFLSSTKLRGSFEIIEVNEKELQGLGEFQTNDSALAVVRCKSNDPVTVNNEEFALVLDDIRDPGNMGTIIRTADWFGINKIIASTETADFYNGKVITSTMGSFTRAKVYYTDLKAFLPSVSIPIYGAYLSGNELSKVNFGKGGLIVIGNESKGINPDLETFITHKITIPAFGKAESLNAAIATGIICYAVRR
jgi:TrmH family RNA methyltransferase